MAFTKKEKIEIQAQYQKWLEDSQAVFVVSYNKMTQKDIDALRAKAREAGGEIHIVKNTLINRVIDQVGLPQSGYFDGSSMVGFAFTDPPSIAKIFNEAATKQSEIFSLKGGYLGKELLDARQVKALAELPSLPVIRAQFMGLLVTPATKLVRTLAEPARRMAFLVKARSEQAQAA